LNVSGLNGVILASDFLRDYVKNNYQNLTVISSVNKAYFEQGIHASKSWYENILKEYDLCVINGNDMYDLNLLGSIKEKERLVLLLNENCNLDCRNRNHHITLQSMLRIQETKDLAADILKNFHCPGYNRGMILQSGKLKDYFEAGIKRYKLQGRGLDVSVYAAAIETYFNP
jgi:hypothetical protein